MAKKDDDVFCTVKTHRLARGWSQEVLAQKIRVRRQAVYDIESGRYLPNTAIALRLARVFGCRVEDLFVEKTPPDTRRVDIIDGPREPFSRLAMARVRDRLVGFSLNGGESMPFGLRPADGLLTGDLECARVFSPPDLLHKTIILMGCDPAFDILGHHVFRAAPRARILCRFASSHRALDHLAAGLTHVAGTHLHNTGKTESNVEIATRKLKGAPCRVVGFSMLEEGLMVAAGNPLGIRDAVDLASPMVRFVNREPGAALRVLLDDRLKQAGISPEHVNGYENQVFTHRQGAFRVACQVADAALGLRVVARAFDLGFVPMAAARCDLVVPDDLKDHPTIRVLLDVLASGDLRKEISAIPGYESHVTGATIARL